MGRGAQHERRGVLDETGSSSDAPEVIVCKKGGDCCVKQNKAAEQNKPALTRCMCSVYHMHSSLP